METLQDINLPDSLPEMRLKVSLSVKEMETDLCGSLPIGSRRVSFLGKEYSWTLGERRLIEGDLGKTEDPSVGRVDERGDSQSLLDRPGSHEHRGGRPPRGSKCRVKEGIKVW